MRQNLNLQSITPQLKPAGFHQSDLLHDLLTAVAAAAILILAFYRLGDYPRMWFDEGSHLHVPKALVLYGTYADTSSEGFRHYGPTIGLGPTVMLPVALSFKLFGIGLLQARLVIVLYLLAALALFFRLARLMGGTRMAWAALLLLLSSRAVALLEYGRQMLGEVPALFFLTAALLLWFAVWERGGWLRLLFVGLLLGLAAITKYQFLLFIAPMLLLAWIANLIYYRTAPQRIFLVPGTVAAASFALWQVYLIVYLGPATAAENLALLRQAAAGAAAPFSPQRIAASMEVLLGRVTFMGSLIPILAYGIFLALPRRREAQQWGILLLLVIFNLGWYALASIGWLRYAFLGMAIACLFIARFFSDLTDGFHLRRSALTDALRQGQPLPVRDALQWALLIWLIIIIAAPLGKTVVQLLRVDNDAPRAMAAFLTEHVPAEAVIETWEPEIGFLTDHRYHYPPAALLNRAIDYVYLGGSPPAQFYDYVQRESPPYVLVGRFGGWSDLYTQDLAARYELVTVFEPYQLYALPEADR